MNYLADLIFIVVYLLAKDFSLWLQDFKFDTYYRIRNVYVWFETSWIVAAVVFIPYHTELEAMIAFCMCLITKGVHDIIKKNYNFEKNLKLNNKSKKQL